MMGGLGFMVQLDPSESELAPVFVVVVVFVAEAPATATDLDTMDNLHRVSTLPSEFSTVQE